MKYFTLATDDFSHGYPRRRRVGISASYASVVLLFGSDDGVAPTAADVERIAADDQIRTLMPGGFVANLLLSEHGAFVGVSQSGIMVKSPDASALEEPPTLFSRHGIQLWVDTRKLYETCTSLFKAVGCVSCPAYGMSCRKRIYADVPEIDCTSSYGGLFDALVNRKSQVAGYTYISPTLTRPDPRYDHFVPSERSWQDHDFKAVEAWGKTRSLASTTAAERRKFQREQCPKCPLQGACSSEGRHKWCSGAFPPAEMINADLVKQFETLVASTQLERWQFLAIARAAGEEVRIGRRMCVLEGFQFRQNRLVIRAARCKTEYHVEQRWDPADAGVYAQVGGYFPLPYVGDYEPTDQAKALWVASLHKQYTRPVTRGWYRCDDAISYRTLRPTRIILGMRRNMQRSYTRDLTDWVDYANVLGDPPAAQEEGRVVRYRRSW